MELVPDKLYFYLDSVWRENKSGGRRTGDLIVCLDSSQKHVKSSKHFGPPLIKTIWEHCNRVDSTRKNGRVFFLTNDKEDNLHTEQRTISAFLMAAYAILRLNWDVHTANNTLLASIPKKLAFFRDYHGDSNFKLNILDCLHGLDIGCKMNQWFLSRNSCVASKIYDMDWIVPNKLLALRDPTIRRETRRRSVSKIAVRELKRLGVSSIIRLNGEDHNHCLDYYGYSYAAEDITKEHFLHYDIPFEDVNTPTIQQVNQFISFCEVSSGRIAVHCHAGLGRSAAMIGCYMIKHYGFDGRSVCAWMKMCRSGSVMGPQHFFFERYEQYLKMHTHSCLDDGPIQKAQPVKQTKPPRKNNIVHIVPGKKRELRKTSSFDKNEHKKKEIKVTLPGREYRNSSSTNMNVPTKSSIITDRAKKVDRHSTRTKTPSNRLISSVMRTPTVNPPCPKQSRKENSLKTYKIPTCYVKMNMNGGGKTGMKTKGVDHTKGPTLMKGKLSKSYEQLQTAKTVDVNSSNSWSQRPTQKHSGMITRSMAKQIEMYGVYSRREVFK